MNLASEKEDVEVFIGADVCEVNSLVRDLLTCTAPDKQPPGYDDNGTPDNDILPWVKVIIKYCFAIPDLLCVNDWRIWISIVFKIYSIFKNLEKKMHDKRHMDFRKMMQGFCKLQMQ